VNPDGSICAKAAAAGTSVVADADDWLITIGIVAIAAKATANESLSFSVTISPNFYAAQ
jgi:hypothetical protein